MQVDSSESNLRARNPTTANVNRKEKKNTANKAKTETICTVFANELDPRSIAQWPGYFLRSVIQALQVISTIRKITFGDIIAGLVNTALLFTFAAVFSSGTFLNAYTIQLTRYFISYFR